MYFSSGLAGIDDSLYEAASMDGANSINQFKNVTLPSIRPIMFFVVVTNIINAFQSFGQIKLLTQGGPGESTNVIVHDIYKNAFMNYRYGYASAESVVLFFIVMVLTIIAFRSNGVKMQRTSNDIDNFRLFNKTAKPRSKKIDKAIGIRLVLNIIVVIFVLFPIIYAFVMSIKPSYELYNKTFLQQIQA